MKTKTKDLRSLNPAELQKELLELLRAQFGLRMQHTTQQLSNTNQLLNVRRDIARAKTILSQKAKQS
ncbi:50S ribosomal protein L29 [Nitrosospira sp. NRS527]|uniref:50S ribosomal protein L29 n=1 Tax=Nitrosospira sp. NRS527 TaxID=155925 RepID=UPI001AF9CB87|nr:50S ribosomal protein L29 [Nitrosospira sp. NRS527]BCT67213.1 50S ribosomal protein L29 [Nitrosospira sp. NRS527]